MPGGARKMRGFAVALALLAQCVAGAGSAEIYRWVDATGKLHFTQDLASVPPAYRAAAKARAEAPKKEIPIQTYQAPTPASSRARRQAQPGGGGGVHTIRVERAGSSMRVLARINDELDVPFIIDTGATDVVIPLSYAKQLGLEYEGPGVRKVSVGTANGVVEAPSTMLDSVKLGTARVEGVKGIILKDMSFGLLGLSFFNHFSYNIDAARGVVTLTENRLAEDGVLRGGRGREQWIAEFRAAHALIETLETRRDETLFGRSRERERWESRVEEARNRLRLLESEADLARVPFAWRD